MLDKVYFGYDVCLNQLIREKMTYTRVMDFPYTFVNKDHLERVLHDEFGKVESLESMEKLIRLLKDR